MKKIADSAYFGTHHSTALPRARVYQLTTFRDHLYQMPTCTHPFIVDLEY